MSFRFVIQKAAQIMSMPRQDDQRLRDSGRFCRSRLQQPVHRIRRLRAILDPMLDPLTIQVHLRWLRNGIIMPDYLDRPAIPCPILLDYHHSIRGFLLGAKPRQANC
jgi:hypothetical protein